jgi:hypothetical protein
MIRIGVWVCAVSWLGGLSPLRAEELTTFSRAAPAADVDVLQQAYEQLHPGLDRYNTPELMQGHRDDLRKALDGER